MPATKIDERTRLLSEELKDCKRDLGVVRLTLNILGDRSQDPAVRNLVSRRETLTEKIRQLERELSGIGTS